MDFGDILEIVIPLLLIFGGGIVKMIGRRASSPIAEPTPEQEPDFPFSWEEEPEMQDLFEEEQEVEPEPKNERKTYFTYEDVNPQVVNLETDNKSQRIVEEEPRQADVVAGAAPDAEQQFDLRKAIIYQTILTNQYTVELK